MPPKLQTKPIGATLLKADFWLQHVTDTSNDDAESDYSQFWLTQTKQKWPDFCCLCGAEPPTCGAHMFSIRADLAGVVIVPACAACNNNVSKTAKYAATKFNVWAAHCSADELQRIERRQRQTARHVRAEARLELIQALPPAGVPIPIHPKKQQQQQQQPERKKYVPQFCVPPDDDDEDEWPAHTSTPRPPSPQADEPEVAAAFRLPPPARVKLGPRPKPSPTAAAVAAVAEYNQLVDRLDEMRQLCSSTEEAEAEVTPRPVRRRERAPARKGAVIDALREVNRCKQPIENDSKFCNSTVCSKLPCSGSSKVYCCAHCGCLSCVKPPSPSKSK